MLSSGSRLGPYEIVSRIGAGGMGEVWKARDTRLGRNVAVKLLPAELAANANFKLRFEREARTISQLNHPNICTLFDVGDDYLVMELLEGETLADRITRGRLPMQEVLQYGIQIADALSRAHRQGVVHRDLKPSNVMITKAGAKLLDFGLAKSSEPAISSDGATEHKALTQEGTILGTFQYMAPEQLEGNEADARTDIFAFGALLYEMATGRRAFEGKNRTSLIAAIVSAQPPPISQLQPLTPPALEHVVAKCLAKDVEDRWQSAHDVADELRWISDAGSQAGVAASTSISRRSRERMAWIVAALLAIGLAAAAVYIARNRREAPPTYSFTVPTTTKSYIWGSPAQISPDGTTLAFAARKDLSSPRSIWIRPVASFDARSLEGTNGAGTTMTWSADSKWILFNAEGKLRRIRADGGAAETVADRPSISGTAMNAAGTVLFTPSEGPLSRVSQGGAPQPITSLDKSRHERAHGSPHFLPDGEHFLFVAFAREPKGQVRRLYLYAGQLDSKEVKFLGEISSGVAYSEPGYLLFVRDGALVAAPFDADKLEIRGEPVTIADSVFYFKPAGVAGVSASRNGTLTYILPVAASSLVWLDGSGKQIGEPVRANESFGGMRIGRDGSRVTIAIADTKVGTNDLWSLGLTRPTATRLTFDEGWEDQPVLSPDGAQMFYSTDRIGIPDIFVKKTGSAEQDRGVVIEAGEQLPADVSPDGKYLVYESDRYDATGDDIWVVRTDGTERPRPIVRTPATELGPRISPDGRWLAYSSNESGKYQVYVKPFPGAGEARQISTVTGTSGRWSPDSRFLYFREWNRVMVADLQIPDAEPQFLFEPDREVGNFEVAPDGKRFLVELTDRLVAQQPTRVIVNWPSMITKQAR